MSNDIYGITQTGYNVKPIDIIEEDLQSNIKQHFGESIDLSSQSPLYKMLRVQGVEVSLLWVKSEDNFYNCFVQTAHGVGLDILGKDYGLERKPATQSAVELTIYKNTTDPVTIPINSLFQTLEGIIFLTDIELVIPSGDPSTTFGTVNATCAVAGLSGNIGVNTIIQPTNNITGVDRSDNLIAATGGDDIESDDDYRLRLDEYISSVWTPQAIRSAVLNVDGVSSCKVIEEATSYNILIVPQTLYTPALEAAILNAVYYVNPITVEFQIIEANIILINITGTVTLDGIDINTAISESTIKITSYISKLDIDDDVYKSKIIQQILNVVGIDNTYSLVLSGAVQNEQHTYVTGTTDYDLGYTSITSITSVTGIVGGSAHTFIVGVDYSELSSPARIHWLSGTLPDNGTVFKVTYTIPADGIGDIIINSESIAKIGTVQLTI